MTDRNYEVIEATGGVPIKAWTRGVLLDEKAEAQLRNVAKMPFVHKWVAVMPDVHWGVGATVGSVIPTTGAIIPAAVGVDIGCGMIATRTTLDARNLPDDLAPLRAAIEATVPHGRTDNGGPNDRGAWHDVPAPQAAAWAELALAYARVVAKHPKIGRGPNVTQLGTLGTGNHFIEVCLDEADQVWFMLHSGSRGVGNRIGSYFIDLAKKDMRRWLVSLPDADLAYLPEGTEHFGEYIEAVSWAQTYATVNRELMMMMSQVVCGGPGVLRAAAVRGDRGGGELPPQLRGARAPLREGRPRDSQGGGARAGRRPRDHSREHGGAFVHRSRPRKRGELRQLQPRRGTDHVARRGEAEVLARRSRGRDGGDRVPQGRRGDRRDARRLQAHR